MGSRRSIYLNAKGVVTRRWWTVLTVLFLALSAVWLTYLQTTGVQSQPVEIKDGYLNNSDWDYLAGVPLKLEGEWEVIWGQLVAPKDFDTAYTGDLFRIPGRWNNVGDPEMNEAYGVATFRAKLDLPDYDKELSFHLISPHSAWRLYANGFFIGGNGIVSDEPGTHRAHYTSRIFPAYPNKSELVLQVSNYSHAFGGPGHPPTIWDSQTLFKTLGLLSLYYSLVLGVLFTIGMFHLIFYLADKKHREHGPVHLWFSLLCFIMVFRISGVIPYFHIYFPSAAYWSDLRFPYASLFAAPAVYILFFRSIFSRFFPEKFTLSLIITNIALMITVLVTPEKFYTHFRDFSIGMNVFVILYSMVFGFRAMLDKQPGAGIILITNAIFLATAINDAWIYTDNGTGFDLTPFGILVLGLGYSYALLLRLQDTFQTARQTSRALETLNLDLEKQVRDRTSKFEAAAAKAENSASDRARFIAAASHDLRQPLHALAMFNSALKNKVKDIALKKLIDKQERSISNMGDLLQDTLDTARAEISHKDPVWTPLELRNVLSDIASRFEWQAKNRDIQLVLDAQPGQIITDGALLQRVLSNLIDNAIKAARAGVQLACYQRDNEWIITVTDDGSGIPRDDIDRIFESYVSLRNPDDNDQGGYGLGLHVVKNFMNSLGGTVQVASSDDRGTVFVLTLPAVPPGHTAITESTGRIEHEYPVPGTRILAIDDEADILDAMTAMLESWDCDVKTAENSAQAKAILTDGFLPDLLIVDYHLFGENGITVVEQLRSFSGKNLAAVIITGATEPAILEKIGACDLALLSKPVNPAILGQFLVQHQTKDALIANAASDAGE